MYRIYCGEFFTVFRAVKPSPELYTCLLFGLLRMLFLCILLLTLRVLNSYYLYVFFCIYFGSFVLEEFPFFILNINFFAMDSFLVL